MAVGSDSTATETEKSLNEFKDQLETSEVENVQKLVEELREIAKKGQEGADGVTAEDIKAVKDKLLDASLTLFSKVHASKREKSEAEGKPEEPIVEENKEEKK